MSETLKPCPFCGQPAKYCQTVINGVRNVMCSNYDCFLNGYGYYAEISAEQWNTRATETQTEELKEIYHMKIKQLDNGNYLAKIKNYGWGAGETPIEAIKDLCSMVEDKYNELSNDSEDILAEHLKLELIELKKLVEKHENKKVG